MNALKRTAALLILALGAAARAEAPPPAEVEKKIDALLARMTLEEKLGQLQQLDGEADGNFRPEHRDLIRQGLLGSTLNVRGARRTRTSCNTSPSSSHPCMSRSCSPST